VEPTTVKNILAPEGTKLEYEEWFFQKGKQNEIMNEKTLHR